jgi:hypothetical protein
MRIEIEKVLQNLPLAEYAPEYGEKHLVVWVNPSRKVLQERIAQAERGQALRSELDELHTSAGQKPAEQALARARTVVEELSVIGRDSLAWMSEILSQGAEDTRMSAEELTAFVADCEELDPGFWPWISKMVWQMISDYRLQKKKA